MQEVEAHRAEIHGRLPAMRAALAQAAAPFVEPGAHCSSPYDCEFYGRLHGGQAGGLGCPSASADAETALASLGRARHRGDLRHSARFPAVLGSRSVIRGALATGQPYIAPDLTRLLGGYGPPAAYLDFEAMMPPIPLYEGTSPYQTLPFQWSLHEMDAAGRLTHREFLAPHDRDPRCSFAETLVAALAWIGSSDPGLFALRADAIAGACDPASGVGGADPVHHRAAA